MKSLIGKLNTYCGGSRYDKLVTLHKGRIHPTITEDDDEKQVLSIVIERKGYFVGTSNKDANKGKYLHWEKIVQILEADTSWIKTAKTSKKFGI